MRTRLEAADLEQGSEYRCGRRPPAPQLSLNTRTNILLFLYPPLNTKTKILSFLYPFSLKIKEGFMDCSPPKEGPKGYCL
ncbi:hypothetical protein NDU88_002592 [Pleurodeles waltl]|uniref:Uncharacterized protein n=1 Tax=Pleurodeles waltl TaxID=8319 RepID=A0AAV7UW25_PLEWA|nr:hypothetical protein NDU88_002592 [Pleurodeles waltl]